MIRQFPSTKRHNRTLYTNSNHLTDSLSKRGTIVYIAAYLIRCGLSYRCKTPRFWGKFLREEP